MSPIQLLERSISQPRIRSPKSDARRGTWGDDSNPQYSTTKLSLQPERNRVTFVSAPSTLLSMSSLGKVSPPRKGCIRRDPPIAGQSPGWEGSFLARCWDLTRPLL